MKKTPVELLADLAFDYDQDRAFRHMRTEGIRYVGGIGAYGSNVLVVGEAPGATENTRREPFCGASGRVLQQLMELAGLRARVEPNCWLTNVVKYRPERNRTPTIGEAIASLPYLRREWAIVGRPSVIVAVGGTAWTYLGPPASGGISANAGQHSVMPNDSCVWGQFHPSYGLRSGQSVRDRMERDWEAMGEWLKDSGLLGPG